MLISCDRSVICWGVAMSVGANTVARLCSFILLIVWCEAMRLRCSRMYFKQCRWAGGKAFTAFRNAITCSPIDFSPGAKQNNVSQMCNTPFSPDYSYLRIDSINRGNDWNVIKGTGSSRKYSFSTPAITLMLLYIWADTSAFSPSLSSAILSASISSANPDIR